MAVRYLCGSCHYLAINRWRVISPWEGANRSLSGTLLFPSPRRRSVMSGDPISHGRRGVMAPSVCYLSAIEVSIGQRFIALMK